jgi:uncharacterized protein (DUF1501 family)
MGALSFDGWDTHADEGAINGRLATLLGALDRHAHPVLGERRLSWTSNRCYRQLRRPEFSRADNRGLGAVTSSMGLSATRHAA